jgi:uncharacterized protein
MRSFLWIAVLAGMATTLQAQSFDCQKATTKVEKAICASPELSKADDAMAAEYKRQLQLVPEEMKNYFVQAQRSWLHDRSDQCTDNSQLKLPECLAQRYKEWMTAATNHRYGDVELVNLEADFMHQDAECKQDPSQPFCDGNKIGKITVSWPLALSSTPEWQAWNKAALETLLTEFNFGEGQKFASLKEIAAKYDGSYDKDVSLSMDSTSAKILSATITNSAFGHGAAHPLTSFSQFNWLIKEKRLVKPEDIFDGNKKWADALEKRCESDLRGKLGKHFEDGEVKEQDMPGTLLKVVVEPQRWLINKNGITITWQQYELACYACTPEPTSIPWIELRDVLNPGFEIPK